MPPKTDNSQVALIEATIRQTEIQTKVLISLDSLRDQLSVLTISNNELCQQFKNGVKGAINDTLSTTQFIAREFTDKNGSMAALSGAKDTLEQLHNDICNPGGYVRKLATKMTYMWVPVVIGLVGYFAGIGFFLVRFTNIMTSLDAIIMKLQPLIK